MKDEAKKRIMDAILRHAPMTDELIEALEELRKAA